MSETEKPSGNWVEQAVAKIPADKLPKPEVEEEAPAVETAAPEPKAEEKPAKGWDDEDDGETETLVDLRALKAERGKRKEAERIAREKEIEFAKASERLALIQQAWEESQKQAQTVQQPQQPQPQVPDRDSDPLGYLEHQLAQEREARARLEQTFQQQTHGIAQQQQVAMLANTYKAAADQFKAATPDFLDAYNDLYTKLDQELAMQGMGDPNARRNHLMNTELQFVATQLRMGKNPAQAVYEMAKLRGYAPKAAEAPAAAASEEVELQNKRQQAMSPLSNAAGKAPSNTTLRDLVNLPAEEFIAKTKGKNWDKLFRSGSR